MYLSDVIVAVSVFKVLITIVTFGYAAISDWIKREINPLVWVPSIVLGIAINTVVIRYFFTNMPQYGDLFKLHLILSLGVSAVFIVLSIFLSFVLGLMGGADVLALASFTSLYPANTEIIYLILSKIGFIGFNSNVLLFLPSIVLILLSYSIILLGIVITNVVYNAMHREHLRKLALPLRKKILYFIIGRFVNVRDINTKRFYYPIYVPGVVERVSFNVDEDHHLWIERLRSLDPETVIVCTWGIPMVTLISIPVFLYVFMLISILLML
uniref:Uncharacterized protein n=1 Tax=Ignisphaera aggregans TaxID=334771 RepID=A0A7C2VD73_9CREN